MGTHILLENFCIDPGCSAGTSRDICRTKLRNSLIVGKTYCAKMWVSPMDAPFAVCYFSDALDMYFDDGLLDTVPISGAILSFVNPQVKNPTGKVINDSTAWTLVSGTFVADSNMTYLTIGNFRPNSAVVKQLFSSIGNCVEESAYYIDDVSVYEQDLPPFAGNDTIIYPGDSLFLGREPEIGLECTWLDENGDSIQTGAGFWSHPSGISGDTVVYVVRQDMCGLVTYDTVNVVLSVWGSNGYRKYITSKITPNPTNGDVFIETGIENIRIEVIDLNGKVVYMKDFTNDSGKINFKLDLPASIYMIKITNLETYENATSKLVIQK